MSLPNKMYTECPYCYIEGLHYWHHVFGGSNKHHSEDYNAVIYPCTPCHTGNTDSIHKQASQEKNFALKREHQERIMGEFDMDLKTWIGKFGRSWL